MRGKKKITILIPTFNEEAVVDMLYSRLNSLVKKLSKYDFELLFVNDGSTDETLEKIQKISKKDRNVSFINLSRNFGKEIAMLAGLDHAQGNATVIIDADLQDPPELIADMIKYWEEGYSDVYARRISRNGETWFKRSTSQAFYRLLKKWARVPIQLDTGDFRLLDEKCVKALTQMRETQRFTKGMFSWIGYSKKEILFEREPRAAGKSKWSYIKLIDLAIEGITSFTTSPLRWSAILGFLISFFAFLYIVIIFVKTIFFGNDLPGYPSVMAAILLLGGVQLLSLGIIGEYIGRIFNETKNRPPYFIEEYKRAGDKK